MSDNVVKLQFDLAQTEANLKKAREENKLLREEVRKCNDEMKNAGASGSEAYKKQSTELRKTASEAEKTTNKIRSMGGALNMIGGAGTGQIAQVAGSIGMLASPMGLMVGLTGAIAAGWGLVSSEIEAAEKRAENLSKSMKSIDEEARKASSGRATQAQGTVESNASLSLIYRDPQEYKRNAQEKYGFTQEQSGGIMSAVMPNAGKIPKENREIFLKSVFDAVQIAQLGAGINPVEAAKNLAADPTAMMHARWGRRAEAGARIASASLGFRVTPEQIAENTRRQIKKPEVLENIRENQLAAPKDPIATGFDMQRKRIENNRKFLENQLRGGPEALKFLEEQQKEKENIKVPFMKSVLGWDERSYGPLLEQTQSEERSKLTKRLADQNPDVSQDKIASILSLMTETIRLNTLSNVELKKSLDANSAKTTENTEATATGMVK
jgi:cell division protein FtsB